MTIFRKDHLAGDKAGLKRYFEELAKLLEGSPPKAVDAALYQHDPETFLRDFADLDLVELAKAAGRFKVEVDHLKKLKERAQKPVHRA